MDKPQAPPEQSVWGLVPGDEERDHLTADEAVIGGVERSATSAAARCAASSVRIVSG
jgi:hypothetical protein